MVKCPECKCHMNPDPHSHLDHSHSKRNLDDGPEAYQLCEQKRSKTSEKKIKKKSPLVNIQISPDKSNPSESTKMNSALKTSSTPGKYGRKVSTSGKPMSDRQVRSLADKITQVIKD